MVFDIIAQGKTLSSTQYEEQAAAVAGRLDAMDVGENDPVLLVLRNCAEFLVASAAVAKIGAYVVPINWHGTARDVTYIAEDCGAVAAIVHDTLLPLTSGLTGMPIIVVPTAIQSGGVPATGVPWSDALGHAPYQGPIRSPREPITYTSGSTGTPKGVRRAAASDATSAEAMRGLLRTIFGAQDGMRTLVLSPLYHAAPASYLRIALASMRSEGLVVIHDRFDAEAALGAIERHRITRLWMVPTMFVALTKLPDETRRQYDLSSLEYIVHSAAPCPADVKRQLLEWFGPVLYEFYGSTEVGPVTLSTPEDFERKPGNVGRAVGGTELLILSDDGTPLAANGIGEIACRHAAWPEFTYINREEDRRELDRGSLVATGDIGYLDADGYLFLCDRKKNMIISGGVNIFPAEIESVALEHDAVKDCAVFGIPDETFGEAVAMAVELLPRAALDLTEFTSFLTERLARYKVPKLIEVVDALPREDSGKIFKQRLREPFWRSTGRSI